MSQPAKPISYQPGEALTYDPDDPRYWRTDLLREEITRVFEICHGCRMCFKYCDAFPSLFDLIDNTHDGDVTRLRDAEIQSVFDQCFQCKLCEVQCPYTPRDQHEYQLDFPKLAHRHKAVQAKKRGRFSLAQRYMADPDGSAKMARATFGLANALSKVRLHRWFMEKIFNIHREKLLPPFAQSTFEKWAAKRGLMKSPGECEALLFQTCYVQNNEPQIGRDVADVLERNQVKLGCVPGLACCGMPAWEQGDLETLRAHAQTNLDKLEPYAQAGAAILVPNPTCAMMLRREYPELVASADRERARRVADAVRDVGEFLWSIRKEERFNTDFKSTPGKVAYHAPCHLRAQAVGFKGRDLLRKIPGTTPTTVMECCGHDGTYAMRVEGFEPSARIGRKAFEGMKNGEADVWASECPLAALQFEQHAGTKALHPVSILARAYRDNGFPTPVPQDKKGSTP